MAEGLVGAGATTIVWGRDPVKNEAAAAALARHGRPVEARAVTMV